MSIITSKTSRKFFWHNIVYRFGFPSEIIVDNVKHFNNQEFIDFYALIKTKSDFASIYHP